MSSDGSGLAYFYPELGQGDKAECRVSGLACLRYCVSEVQATKE